MAQKLDISKVYRVVTPFMEVMKKPPWIPENHDRSRVKQLPFRPGIMKNSSLYLLFGHFWPIYINVKEVHL